MWRCGCIWSNRTGSRQETRDRLDLTKDTTGWFFEDLRHSEICLARVPPATYCTSLPPYKGTAGVPSDRQGQVLLDALLTTRPPPASL